MKLRVPGWMRNEVVPGDLYTYTDGKQPGYTVKLNSQPVACQLEKGYFTLNRTWKNEIRSILLPSNPEIQVVDRPELLSGIKQLKTQTQSLFLDRQGMLHAKNGTLTLIPYYAWCHRRQGEMAVWLPQDVSAVRPTVEK